MRILLLKEYIDCIKIYVIVKVLPSAIVTTESASGLFGGHRQTFL